MNKVYETEQGEYLISTDFNKLQLNVIHDYLSKESYWAQNIPFEIVEKAAENSLCFGVFHQNKQIGFARLITDKTTFAYLGDVFIVEGYRGKGLSKWLMQTIHAHPELQTLRGWILRTKDAHGLYEQFGWTRASEEQLKKIMIRYNENVYKTP